MAKEIGDIVKTCKILLLDIEGTTTSISFVKDKLFPYVEDNVQKFLDTQWGEDDVKEAVIELRKLAVEDQESSVDGAVKIPDENASKEEQIEGLVSNIKWQMSNDRKSGPLKFLQGLIWKQGYDNGDIKGHVYDDVLPALEQWRAVDDHKVYIYSSGSVQAQKLLFGQSTAGDLLKYIDGHFDTAVGAKQEEVSYKKIVENIGCKPEEILFLTDIVKEAEAGQAAGIQVAVVCRASEAEGAVAGPWPVVRSLAQLAVAHKRKTEPQDEQPAKVKKTDLEDDVKTESQQKESTNQTEEKNKKVEQMEVESDESVGSTYSPPVTAVVMSVSIEEVTDESEYIPICDAEPVIVEENENGQEEKDKKTEQIEREIKKNDIEPEPTETNNDVDKVLEGEKAKAEETPPTIISEIEELSNDKQSLSEVGEIIDDIVPVIEEPIAVEDMEVLKNAGEVLEKECDEILSKVQNVTNLDNMPIKPLLNPIAEEMETDNTDSNDIVDRILDRELELEMRQCADIDLQTVSEIAEEQSSEMAVEQPVSDMTVEQSVTEIAEEKLVSDVVGEVNVCSEENKITEVETAECLNSTESPKESKPLEEPIDDVRPEESKSDSNINIAPEPETKVPQTETTVKATTETTTVATIEVTTEATKEVPTESIKEVTKEVSMKVTTEATTEVTAEATTEATTEAYIETKSENNEKEEVKEANDEAQVNGKSNGDAEQTMNGDLKQDDELSSRLTVENGKEIMNGSNGQAEEKQGPTGEGELEIKVKSVAAEEPPAELIEQPTEA